jgi:hypothetical protein
VCAAQLYAAYDVVIIGVLLRLRTRAGRGAGRGARGGRTFMVHQEDITRISGRVVESKSRNLALCWLITISITDHVQSSTFASHFLYMYQYTHSPNDATFAE